MKQITSAIALTICLVTSFGVTADTVSEEQLNKAYIEGFLAGAQLTDNEIIKRLSNAEKKTSEDSSFFDRAFKTRVGNVREQRPGTFYAGFCLPEDKADKKVVEAILQDIAGAESGSETDKAGLIYQTLQSRYPC